MKEIDDVVENTELEVIDRDGELMVSVLRFKKPYEFEGKKYTHIDLSGLENLKASDMIAVSKALSKSGDLGLLQEMSLDFACRIASRATGLPVELFTSLPMKEGMRLKNRVTGFLYGTD